MVFTMFIMSDTIQVRSITDNIVLFLSTKGSLVNYRAHKPYTLVGHTSIAWY